MSLRGKIRRHVLRLKAARLARDEKGATLIEFGFLALPFFAILGATLETALVFFAAQILDSAVGDASRIIRTGQAQNAEWSMADFRQSLCSRTLNVFNCDAIRIRVHTVNLFANATYAAPVDEDGNWTLVEDYNDGGPSSIVFVEAYYKWPVAINLFGFNLVNQPDGTHLLGSSRVFKNEPF